MSFPPRCYYCRRIISWPFGLRIFRGSRRLHVAHRSCFTAHAHGRREQRRLTTWVILAAPGISDRVFGSVVAVTVFFSSPDSCASFFNSSKSAPTRSASDRSPQLSAQLALGCRKLPSDDRESPLAVEIAQDRRPAANWSPGRFRM
jgi:hypothetical protein